MSLENELQPFERREDLVLAIGGGMAVHAERGHHIRVTETFLDRGQERPASRSQLACVWRAS